MIALLNKAEPVFAINRNFKLGVTVLILLFILIRLFHINSPVLDRHSWNQISAASSAMNIYKDPATFWAPDSNVFKGDSEDSILAQEFPVFMGLVALGYWIAGPEIWVARIIAISIALIGWIFLLRLLLISEKRATVLFIMFLYTINSHNWFFDRAINSDTGMVSFMLASLYYFWQFMQDRSVKNSVLLLVTTLLAGLFKPYGLQIGISFIYLLVINRRMRLVLDWRLILIGTVVWVVNLGWLLYTEYYLPASISIGHDLGFNLKDLFSVKFVYVMQQRFFDQITTQFLMLFCIFAIASRKIRNDFAMALLFANLFYLSLITHGNLVHNYYQLPFTPALIVFSGLGFLYWLRAPVKKISPKVKASLAIFLLIGYVGYSGKKTWNHFRLSIGPKLIGDQIKAMDLPENTRLISLESSGTRFHETLYYADKKGWVRRQASENELQKLRSKGAEIVTVHYEEKDFSNPEKMAPLRNMLKPVWESYDCRDSYGKSCLVGIYRFKDH